LYAQLDDNALPKNASPQDKINKLNTFLEEIKRALLFKTTVTMENYVTMA